MKKTLATLLALIMLLGLVACASEPATIPDAPTTDTPAVETPAETPDEPAEEPTDEPAEAPADEPIDEPATEPTETPVETSVYPICAPGEITLTAMGSLMNDTLTNMENDFSQNIFYRELEKITGIHLEFDFMASNTFNEQFNLMLVSEDYPDIGLTAVDRVGSPDQAYEDGVLINLMDYQELVPNYLAQLNKEAFLMKSALTDQSNLMGFYMIYDRMQPGFCNYWFRGDWLEEMNFEIPETVDEWEEILVAFRDTKTGGAGPMDVANTGLPGENNIASAYGIVSKSPYMIQREGVVACTVVEDSYRDFLALMAKWYNENLINRDFLSTSQWAQMGAGPDETRMSANQSGAFPGLYSQSGSYWADVGIAEEGFYAVMVPHATLEKGVANKVGIQSSEPMRVATTGALIFAEGEHVEEAIKMYDYVYSEEGVLLSNWGIEGETFAYDENGDPYYIDMIANNPLCANRSQARELYLMHSGAKLMLVDGIEDGADAAALAYYDVWNNVGEWNMPSAITFTAEEGEERSSLLSDIDTYVAEYTTKVISGMIELNDDTWNEYLETLNTMNIGRVVEITQAAYDRYTSR